MSKISKPDRSMKIVVTYDESSDDSKSIKYDYDVFSQMESNMLLIYNTGKYSRYQPTDVELVAIKRNIELVRTSGIAWNSFSIQMIESIYDDIRCNTVPPGGYNKRALIGLIDIIKECWLSKYPEFVSNIEIKL